MDFAIIGLIGVGIMMILILLGVHLGMAMGIVGVLGYWYISGYTSAFAMIRSIPFSLATQFSFSVIPLFVLMGHFAFHSGLSGGLYSAADKWLCRLRGGLAIASVLACAAFAAICGSSAATGATMGTIALPEMKKAGYNDALATGTLAAGATLGILIPPSTVFIVYAITAEQSVGKLFAAGIIPGIILALSYAMTVYLRCRINPGLAPAIDRRFTLKEKILSLKGILPVVILFASVIGGMFAGLFSSTEAAAIGALIGLIFMFVNRQFTFRKFLQCLVDTVQTTGMLFGILFGAMAFGYFLTITSLPARLADFVAGLAMNRYLVILIIVLIYLILGCIMDSMSMILITIPIFLPIASSLGFSPIWFGVLIVLVAELGQMTPPVGLNVFVIAGVARDVPLMTIFRGVIPFVVACLIVTVLVVFIEPLSLFLPGLLYS